MFWWREEVRPGLWVAFTGAAAGNLALHTGDDPVRVSTNRRRMESLMGIAPNSLRFMNQTHSSVVADSTAGPPEVPHADALVSPDGGAALAVLVADCVPVILADISQDPGSTAAVHAGRRGVEGGIVAAAVTRMRAHGASAVRAWVGPAVCGSCYEVPADMQAAVAQVAPEAAALTRQGTPALDLQAAVAGQLERCGVETRRIHGCTREEPGLFSYRRDGGAAGRCAGLIWRA